MQGTYVAFQSANATVALLTNSTVALRVHFVVLRGAESADGKIKHMSFVRQLDVT